MTMKIYKFDGLICTDVEVTFEGTTKILRNVELMGLIGLDLLEKYRALIDVEIPAVTMKIT